MLVKSFYILGNEHELKIMFRRIVSSASILCRTFYSTHVKSKREESEWTNKFRWVKYAYA